MSSLSKLKILNHNNILYGKTQLLSNLFSIYSALKGKFTLLPSILEKYFLNTFLKFQKVIHIV